MGQMIPRKVMIENARLRRLQVVEWRKEQVTYREIGERLGISGARARQLYTSAKWRKET